MEPINLNPWHDDDEPRVKAWTGRKLLIFWGTTFLVCALIWRAILGCFA